MDLGRRFYSKIRLSWLNDVKSAFLMKMIHNMMILSCSYGKEGGVYIGEL